MTSVKAGVHCNLFGMSLYSITREEDYEQMIDFYNSRWQNQHGFHINGKKENGTWVVKSPKKENLYSKAIPEDQSGGDCLSLFGSPTIPKTRTVSCTNTNYWHICEWDLVTKYEKCPNGECLSKRTIWYQLEFKIFFRSRSHANLCRRRNLYKISLHTWSSFISQECFCWMSKGWNEAF